MHSEKCFEAGSGWLLLLQLNAEFAVRFEAPHVINARKQVWAGTISSGSDEKALVATYDHVQKVGHQCTVVPISDALHTIKWFFVEIGMLYFTLEVCTAALIMTISRPVGKPLQAYRLCWQSCTIFHNIIIIASWFRCKCHFRLLQVAFQDSLGGSVSAIASVVPDGLLVFFPSYSLMDRLFERWQVSALSASGFTAYNFADSYRPSGSSSMIDKRT